MVKGGEDKATAAVSQADRLCESFTLFVSRVYMKSASPEILALVADDPTRKAQAR